MVRFSGSGPCARVIWDAVFVAYVPSAGSESDADVERVETAEQEERRIRFQELVLRGVEEEEEARGKGYWSLEFA